MVDKKTIGKKSRESGQRFEVKVRKDLESKNWIVDRFTNNVEFYPEIKKGLNPQDYESGDKIIGKMKGKLIPAKPKFIYNPQLKRRIPIGMNSGFPDFIAFRKYITDIITDIEKGTKIKYSELFEVIGVEVKSNGKLSKEEKEKIDWLLSNNIFSKVLIASKSKKRGSIVYKEFEK